MYTHPVSFTFFNLSSFRPAPPISVQVSQSSPLTPSHHHSSPTALDNILTPHHITSEMESTEKDKGEEEEEERDEVKGEERKSSNTRSDSPTVLV